MSNTTEIEKPIESSADLEAEVERQDLPDFKAVEPSQIPRFLNQKQKLQFLNAQERLLDELRAKQARERGEFELAVQSKRDLLAGEVGDVIDRLRRERNDREAQAKAKYERELSEIEADHQQAVDRAKDQFELKIKSSNVDREQMFVRHREELASLQANASEVKLEVVAACKRYAQEHGEIVKQERRAERRRQSLQSIEEREFARREASRKANEQAESEKRQEQEKQRAAAEQAEARRQQEESERLERVQSQERDAAEKQRQEFERNAAKALLIRQRMTEQFGIPQEMTVAQFNLLATHPSARKIRDWIALITAEATLDVGGISAADTKACRELIETIKSSADQQSREFRDLPRSILEV